MRSVDDSQDSWVEASLDKVEGLGVAYLAKFLQNLETIEIRCDGHLALGEVVDLVKGFLRSYGVGETSLKLGYELLPVLEFTIYCLESFRLGPKRSITFL